MLIISLIILIGRGNNSEQAKQKKRRQIREGKIFTSEKKLGISEMLHQPWKRLHDGWETGNDHYRDVCFGENNSCDKWDN